MSTSEKSVVLPSKSEKIVFDSQHYPHSSRTLEELEELKNRYDKIGLSQVKQALAPAGLGLSVVSIRKPESYGTGHVIYLVKTKQQTEELVFRSNTGWNKLPEVVLVSEKLATDVARRHGVPTNEIIYVDISRRHVPFDFQIQKAVPGLDLEDHFSGDKATYDKMSFQLGTMLAKLHQANLPGFGRFDQAALAGELRGSEKTNYDYIMLDVQAELGELAQGNYISLDQAEAIIEYYNQRKEIINIARASLVHYDVADHNLMFQKDRITGLIDWEAIVASDPVLDIASCPTWKTHYPRIEKLLEGYRSVAELPDDFDERYDVYRLRTLLWKTVFCHKAGILTPERLKRLSDALDDLKIR